MGEHESVTNKTCPKCGNFLIINDAGATWCCFEKCDYAER